MSLFSTTLSEVLGATPFEPAAPPSTNFATNAAALPLRVHCRLNDTDAASAPANIGTHSGFNVAWVNTTGIKRRLGSLVRDPHSGGRSIALNGDPSNPGHLTGSGLVTAKSHTIGLFCQPDRLTSKMIPITQGQGGDVDGAYSIELIEDAATSKFRVRWWTSIDGDDREVISSPVVEPGKISLILCVQIEGTGRFIYVNDVLVGQDTTYTAFPVPFVGTEYIGCWPTGAAPFDGLIQELMSADVALSANQRATLARWYTGTRLELTAFSKQFAGSSSGTIDLVEEDLVSPNMGWTLVVVDPDTDATSLITFEEDGGDIAWATGAVAGNHEPTIKLTNVNGDESAPRVIPVSVQAEDTPPPPSGDFDCASSGAGTLVDLGSQDGNQATTTLATGGNARYDASGIIKYLTWNGTQGCSSPNRSATGEQFLFRFQGAHNGGCISGGAIVGNIDQHHNYDGSNQWAQLYPCSDGGQIYARSSELQNFTIEGYRFHAVWDPIRVSRVSGQTVSNIIVKGCWATCVRDDFVENDTGASMKIQECLVGDTIGQNIGCWVFFSCSGGSGQDNIVEVTDSLIWNSAVYAPSRSRAVNGYAHSTLFKVDRTKTPRLHIHDTVFMVDQRNIGGDNGNPMNYGVAGPSAASPITESSGNIIIWRDLGNVGSYPWEVPPGFTLLTGSEGTSYWNERVAAWKVAHPHVRRLNVTRPRAGGASAGNPSGPQGANVTVNDQG